MRSRPAIIRATVPVALVALAGVSTAGAAFATQDNGDTRWNPFADDAKQQVTVQDSEGEKLGTVTFDEQRKSVVVTAELEGLTPGFHGFHIHETGKCDPEADDGPFTSAGGHFSSGGKDHPNHAGDLPPLLVSEDGTAQMSVETDRFTLDDLADEDGSTLIVHSGPDNFANVPERYLDAPAPDEDTRSTGDAGDRDACGTIAEP